MQRSSRRRFWRIAVGPALAVAATLHLAGPAGAADPLRALLLDYNLPKADSVPDFEVATNETLCTHNVLGVKGAGEAGAIGSTPAVINAVVDALSDLGVDDIALPATPERVWQAIQQASA